MSRIKILPEILANKIAAGEVVERPASVVKELCENAIDAKSTKIIIDIEQGGRSLIRVADNGIGMNHDEALLALERYATSKIAAESDLFAIRSLGFRGEALPSITSVSRMTLITRDAASEAGVQIEVHGGRVQAVTQAGAPVGTMITVKSLFYNTPVRRKFLKSVATETGHIVDAVTGIFMGQPHIQVRLSHNRKPIKTWPATADPLERAVDILGKETRRELQSFHVKGGPVNLTGWVASPGVARTTGRSLFVYVNGRFVKDRVIQQAIFEGYRGHLMKGRFPVGVIFMEVPSDQVDVNVHPTKHQVRFAEQRAVFDAVAEAVKKALDLTNRPPWMGAQAAPPSAPPRLSSAEGAADAAAPQAAGTASSQAPLQGAAAPALPAASPSGGGKVAESVAPLFAARPAARDREPSYPPETQQRLWEPEGGIGDLRILGQAAGTYIVCESEDGLMLLDQHAAHERILYERLQHQRESIPAQKLLMPEVMELGFREAGILEGLAPLLAEFGLEIEPFGGRAFAIKSAPAFVPTGGIKELILEMVERAIEIGAEPSTLAGSRDPAGPGGIRGAVDDFLKLMACHGAIRAHQPLAEPEIRSLLRDLGQCENPSQCPHGRPTWIRLTLRDLEKSFKRIV